MSTTTSSTLPVQTRHVLGLARRQLREVHAAQHTGRRYRAVRLAQVEPVPGERGELGIGEPLEERAPGIGVQLRGDLPCAGDGELASFHWPRSW